VERLAVERLAARFLLLRFTARFLVDRLAAPRFAVLRLVPPRFAVERLAPPRLAAFFPPAFRPAFLPRFVAMDETSLVEVNVPSNQVACAPEFGLTQMAIQ
jgi:hypothetical protein